MTAHVLRFRAGIAGSMLSLLALGACDPGHGHEGADTPDPSGGIVTIGGEDDDGASSDDDSSGDDTSGDDSSFSVESTWNTHFISRSFAFAGVI